MPPTCFFVNNTPMLGVQFSLDSAIHTCEEPLKQAWLRSDNIETNKDFVSQALSEGTVNYSQSMCQDSRPGGNDVGALRTYSNNVLLRLYMVNTVGTLFPLVPTVFVLLQVASVLTVSFSGP